MFQFVSILLLLLPLASFAKDAGSTEQVNFITNFYREYLDATEAKRVEFTKGESFFSKSALKAIEQSNKVCAEKVRGDDICGYAADGDLFLNAQEISPDLKFRLRGPPLN